MKESILPTGRLPFVERGSGLFVGTARRLLMDLLENIEYGQVMLLHDSKRTSFGRIRKEFPLEAVVTVHDPRFFTSILFGGSIGAGESYMFGHWTVDDLTTLIRIFIRNEAVFQHLDKGWAWLRTPLHLVYQAFRRNTEEGSRLNVAAHYDLGNAFYALLLDGTLTYSCGIFEKPESTLEEASIAKMDRICRKLELSQGDCVIEIGTGWGGFAIHAAGNYGCRVTTTTISRAQWELARERVARAGLEDRVEVLFQDYRHLTGTYDKLVSVEMIEGVGHQYLDHFLGVCSNLLDPHGSMMLQAITIRDQVFDRHKVSVDFIKRYIFPGSCIPSVSAICNSVVRRTDLRLFHLEDITPHYARTLREWRGNLQRNVDAVRRLGYSDTFIRMWEYYLCYCEAGFAERYLGDVQMLFTKPLCHRPPLLPPLAPKG
ncbi:MAG: class I SAM-dependent methyltransferase [Deltaproteobacteria bacterium]|nr:class I SAM-dependent methyltransferase [Deltaproteobacteria bacterium]